MKVGIIGFGPLGKQLLIMLQESGVKDNNIILFDDNIDHNKDTHFPFNDYQRVDEDIEYIVALGYHNLNAKRKILNYLLSKKANILSFIHKTAYIHPLAKIGHSVIIFPGCIIEQNVHLANGCISYNATVIAHDCTIGNSTFMAPNVTICGNTTVGDCSFIGASTTIGNNLYIGDNVKIGMSSSIQNNVDNNIQCIGNPMKIVKKLLLEK